MNTYTITVSNIESLSPTIVNNWKEKGFRTIKGNQEVVCYQEQDFYNLESAIKYVSWLAKDDGYDIKFYDELNQFDIISMPF